MIEPKVLKGFRDYLPEIMIPKKQIINKLEIIFESFGFVPIDTPALEYTEILLGKGGGETDKQVYRFNDHGNRDVCLRYDLTVPLARFIAAHYHELVFPFKRYHIGPVWRGENTSRGRYREFYQCDFDILGSDSINADLEILLMIKNGFDSINTGKFLININHRKILNSFLTKLGIIDKSTDILRIIDKIYKIGAENTAEEMHSIGIDLVISNKILKFINFDESKKTPGIINEEIFNSFENIKIELGLEYIEYINEIEYLFKSFQKMEILDCFAFNPAITRGLDYYTGIVFETFIIDSMEFGSVCSGGRYDNLTGLYSKNSVTGVGGSFGLDRLLSLMENKSLLEKKSTKTELLIFNLDSNFNSEYQNLANNFRKQGIKTETVFEKQKIGNQFKFAEKKIIKFVLIAGEEEIKNNKYNLKNVITSEEKKALSIEEIVETIKG